MERIGQVLPSNGRTTHGGTSPQPSKALAQLAMLMAQAQAYFPFQELPPDTPKVYLRAWDQIAQTYGIPRFEIALWNVLRRANFFPLPNDIETECDYLRRNQVRPPSQDFEAHLRRIRERPETMVRLSDIVQEAVANVERRKRERAEAAKAA